MSVPLRSNKLHLYVALREADFGNIAAAKQGVAGALALAPGRDVKMLSALALDGTTSVKLKGQAGAKHCLVACFPFLYGWCGAEWG